MAGKFVICLVAAFALIEPFNTLPAPEAAPEAQFQFWNPFTGKICNRDATTIEGQFIVAQKQSPEPISYVFVDPSATVPTTIQESPSSSNTVIRSSQPDLFGSFGRPNIFYSQNWQPKVYRAPYQYQYQYRIPSQQKPSTQGSPAGETSTESRSSANQLIPYIGEIQTPSSPGPRQFFFNQPQPCCKCVMVQSLPDPVPLPINNCQRCDCIRNYQ